ncbi:MAG: aminotransferase class I/II-fold pyridoxal phosphate-dependent enzyme [Candidatus Diapherotrites archaeon]|uniref:Aminotransferase class I/II-fold pyridoxal phosphate-dependent enzyme n=1 Tax=Candidatus Iainarchaeum sp. TaxID=3101447 RepID=A0A8T3YKQ1_9ARCH|nr:aminotransferase class I/II-fold pyridoxal phosphate-dependent enzyme [Candidatus Diapherotrites archaeon]
MKPIQPAKRTAEIRHAIRDVVPIAQQVEKSGKKVLYLNIGDPMVYDYRTPEHMWQAMLDNKEKAEGYTDSLGTLGARKAVADYAMRMGAPEVSAEDVLTFVGGSEAITLSMQALMNPGENCMLPNPGYSIYTGELAFLECKANRYDLDEEKEWEPDVGQMEKQVNAKTRAIVVISPNNPTGGAYPKSALKKVIDVAGANNIPIFADETYDQLMFDGEKFTSMASLAKDVPVISFGSISKNYLAPGFRGGWLYRHDPEGAMTDYFEAIKKFSRLRLSTVAPVQFAMEAALNGPQGHLKELVPKLQRRRDLTYKRLNEIEGLSCVKPKGAFYAYPRINFPLPNDSDKEFVIGLLKETGVLVVYGEGFGQKKGTHHFRVVFLPPEQTLGEAFDKIEEFIGKNYLGKKAAHARAGERVP